MKLSPIALFLIFMTMATKSHALFEARLTQGFLWSSPDLNAVAVNMQVPGSSANYGLGIDAIFLLPFANLGLGIRYENLGFKSSTSYADVVSSTPVTTTVEFTGASTRTALLFNYRWTSNNFFFGPIVSYGISHSNYLNWTKTTTFAPTTSANLSPNSSSSYSLGGEFGWTLGSFILGGELGYLSNRWNSMRDSSSTVTATPDLSMSGSYLKFIFGFGI